MKKSFLLYAEYEQYFDMLDALEQAKLLKALFTAFKGENVDDLSLNMDNATKMAFSFMCNQLKMDEEKYQQKCETNRKNGAKGGAPKGNQNAVKNKQMINGKDNSLSNECLISNENSLVNECLLSNNNLPNNENSLDNKNSLNNENLLNNENSLNDKNLETNYLFNKKYYITKKKYLSKKDNLTKNNCQNSTLNKNKNNRTVIFLTQNNPKQQDIDKEKDNDKDKDKVKDINYSLVNKKNKNIIDYIINNARAREKEITLLKEKFSYKNIYEKLKPAYLLTLEVMNLLKSNLSQFNQHIRYAKQVYKVSELKKYLDNISINDLIDIAQTTTYNSQIINKKAYILGAILCKSTSGATKNFDKTITNEVKNITANEFNNVTANEFEKITMQEVINNTANECTSTNKNKIINSNLNDYEELYEKLKVIYGCK